MNVYEEDKMTWKKAGLAALFGAVTVVVPAVALVYAGASISLAIALAGSAVCVAHLVPLRRRGEEDFFVGVAAIGLVAALAGFASLALNPSEREYDYPYKDAQLIENVSPSQAAPTLQTKVMSASFS